ncbi:MAG: hypothetical protein ACK52I_01515 [Pseudomonadota bacterium]
MSASPETVSLVMSAAEVATLVGVSKRSIERAALNPASPYHTAKINDGIDSLRFRRSDIERIINGDTARVLPMRGSNGRR